jgi:hypothetical protein
MGKDELAQFVADYQAEQSLIVRAAFEYELISEADASRLRGIDIAAELKKRSYHARGLADLAPDELRDPEVARWGNRLTTFPTPGFRLPIPFVRLALEALRRRDISRSRAAELLMITEDDLRSRFEIEANSVVSSSE